MKITNKLCPDCGSRQRNSDEPFCPYCGTGVVTQAELPRDIWKDPSVKEALKEGRLACDICVLRCRVCDELGYYNEGTSFSCRFCDTTFLIGEDDDVIRLDDTVTECGDGYHNRTL